MHVYLSFTLHQAKHVACFSHLDYSRNEDFSHSIYCNIYINIDHSNINHNNLVTPCKGQQLTVLYPKQRGFLKKEIEHTRV